MDDSPDQEGKAEVKSFCDPRIQYLPNRERLGCSGNIDQAFVTSSLTNSSFACVLEDDNWYLPKFLEYNIHALEQHCLSVLLRNQAIFIEGNNANPVFTGNTTRGHIFTEGVVTVLQLRSSIFFCEGVSNGGLFWRTSAKSNLQVGPSVMTSPMQEYCRTIRISEPIVYAAEPLAIFSLARETSRERLANRAFNRGRQSILQRLISYYGHDLIRSARAIATTPAMQWQIDAALCDTLRFPMLSATGYTWEGLFRIAKGIAKMATTADPLARFWRKEGTSIFTHDNL